MEWKTGTDDDVSRTSDVAKLFQRSNIHNNSHLVFSTTASRAMSDSASHIPAHIPIYLHKRR